MKVSKNLLDGFIHVGGFAEKFLIGAGTAALVAKAIDDKGIQDVYQNWSAKEKTKYAIAMAGVTLVIMAVDFGREMILNYSYDNTFAGEDEIDMY